MSYDYVEYTKIVGATNIFGQTNWRIDLVGGFTYTGQEVHAATSSIETTCGWFYSASDVNDECFNIGPTLTKVIGSAHFNLNFGIDPISVPLRDFTETMSMYCNQYGDLVN